MTAPTYFWEDIDPGFEIETAQHKATTEEIIEFAQEFDPQPFHLDAEAAKDSLLGGLCASGWHICSLSMRLVYDALLCKCAAQGSPGMEEVRWRKPLFVEDTVRVKVHALEKRASASKPDIGLIRWQWEMLNQNNETIALMSSWVMMSKRPQQSGTTSGERT
ncbi:MAG: MaoC family dehydratase [Parvibaculaceae bacterium]|nr:MaoC family dehydratase [Parvibaculaceae bacterium]